MKALMTFALLFCISHFCSLIAQPCNGHAFHAESQQELDNFSILHRDCEEFNGSIYVAGASIKNLDAISQLKVIHGSLTIMNTDVSSIEFNQLQSIKGGLYIVDNYKLRKLDSFNNLDSVAYALYINENKLLDEIFGFQKLSKVHGVEIRYNPVLERVIGFENLETIGGPLYIFGNERLDELSGFNALDSIGYDFDIRSNSSLKRIENFTKLRVVNENMHFWDNPQLEYIGNFNALEKIGIELNIESNEKLTTIEGFSNLEYLKSLFINNSDSLSNIGTFSKLHTVDSSLVLINTGLKNLEFLRELKSVKDLTLLINDRLINLEGLDSLEIAGDLSVARNAVLESTKGLTSLTYCGTLDIGDNPVFQKVEDLLMINTQELQIAKFDKNPLLSDSLSPFLCKLITEAPGKLSLYRNGPGCSFNVEIATACKIELGCNAINAHLANHEDLSDFLEKNQGCTSLNNVYIGPLNHLNGLETLDSIHGYLAITTFPHSNIEVLENIVWIGGDLGVSNWNTSHNFEELRNLTHVGGDFVMDRNSTITTFDGLLALKNIGGKIFLTNNEFESFGEWPALESAGGLELRANRKLKQSTGFTHLKELKGNFWLSGNSELQILSGFDSLEKIGGSFEFRNIATHTIAPFLSLQEIGGDFFITSRDKLKQIGPQPRLARIGGSFLLTVTDSIIASDFFPILTEIGGDIFIEGTENLQSLSFFKQLTHLDGGLTLINNYGLRTLEAFENIDTIAFLTIDQSRLDSLSGFQKLSHIAQDLTLGNIYDMNTFELAELISIGGNFISQSSIKKLSMPKLQEVGADFELRLIHTFNLEGLPSIKKIGGKFSIKQGYNLETLNGIPNELIIGGPVILTNNNRLNWCHSTPICNALQDTDRPHEISLNGIGCENLQKVISQCLLLDTEEMNTSLSPIRIYPNPASDQIIVSFENIEVFSNDMIVTLHDIFGKQVIQTTVDSGTENVEINVSGLNPGMYILNLRSAIGQRISSQKIIVQR